MRSWTPALVLIISRTELRKLPVDGYELRMSRVTRSNVSAIKFDVFVDGKEAHEDHATHEPRGETHAMTTRMTMTTGMFMNTGTIIMHA